MEYQTATNSSPADGIRLIEFVRDQDVPCPSCKYNLRGLLSTRCPECGTELRLTVGIVDRPIAAYVTLLVLSVLPAGLGAFLLFVVMKEGLPPRGAQEYYSALTMCITSWLGIGFTLLTILLGKKIRACSSSKQHLFWIIVLINDVVLLLAIGSMMR